MAQDKDIVLRQYELMINSANQVTGWRQTANSFYLAVNTTLLAVATYVSLSTPNTAIALSFVGILVSVLWKQHIDYYRTLNCAKFKVIHEIEKKLPIKMFLLEHKHYSKEKCSDATQTESKIPWLFALAYGTVLAFQIMQLISIK